MANRTNGALDTSETFDVVIIGAGISGINCAYRLKSQLPNANFIILEARDNIGGTWDFFKYPGIRSDSDLFTFGFAWNPWPYDHPIAEGPLIMSYLKDCVSKTGIDQHIRFRQMVVSADWSSTNHQWTAIVDQDGTRKEFTSQFIILGTGYYDYKTPLQTKIPGLENFRGDVIHPQFWPDDYEYADKKIVIIGSGATSITLFPNLIKKASNVTIVQRSPSYIVSSRNMYRSFPLLRKFLPLSVVAFFMRACYLMTGYLAILYFRTFPTSSRELIRKWTAPELPKWVSQETHFNPTYNPWDQRLCLSPDGDFYQALRSPRGFIVTGHIRTITERSVQMEDGTSIDADVVITATGLNMRLGGGIQVSVDGGAIDWAGKVLWNGAMVQGVPNLMLMIGYVDASWTLGADDSAWILVRLMKILESKGVKAATPRVDDGVISRTVDMWPLKSTYFNAARKLLPVYGDKGCWKRRENIIVDYLHARWVSDQNLSFNFRCRNSCGSLPAAPPDLENNSFVKYFPEEILCSRLLASPRRSSTLNSPGVTILQLGITSDQITLDDTISKAISIHGRVDVLVNNAAYAMLGSWEDVDRETAEFGIKTLLIEPGKFRTKLLSTGSAQLVPTKIPDYASPNAKFVHRINSEDQTQSGDTGKGVHIIVDLVRREGCAATREVPSRLPLGRDCYDTIKEKCEKTLAVLRDWESVIKSTDYDA
ncbi:hypothetical protein F4775DRAFT_588885 [Biscogniauxia sp. FL1348]|nr:hypothetical protein F4775DRAFT_588885 [Biscogniauxia sp. FL1348]